MDDFFVTALGLVAGGGPLVGGFAMIGDAVGGAMMSRRSANHFEKVGYAARGAGGFLAGVFLIITGMMVFSSAANAQQLDIDQYFAPCYDGDETEAQLRGNFGESREAYGYAPRADGVMELWRNDETGTWTITVQRVDGLRCALLAGDLYTPVDEPPPIPGEEG